MKSTYPKALITAGLFLATFFSGFYEFTRGTAFDRREIIETENGRIEIPLYNPLKLKKDQCSTYARWVSRDVFHKSFREQTDAWNRRYLDRLIGEVSNETIYEAINQDILKPGMILGVINPKSKYQNKLDITEKKVKYTHNITYIGKNKKGIALFAHQFHNKTGIITLDELVSSGLILQEIIDSR